MNHVATILALALLVAGCMNNSGSSSSKALPSTAPTRSSTGVPAPGAADPVGPLVKQALEHQNQGEFRKAEIYLSQAVEMDNKSLPAWLALAGLRRTMVTNEIKQGSWTNACELLQYISSDLNRIRSLAMESVPGATADVVVAEENAASIVSDFTRTTIRNVCHSMMRQARKKGDAAHHWWRTNNREEVVAALRTLRPVFLLTPCLDADTYGNANQVLSELRGLVDKDEWDDILGRAGMIDAPKNTATR